jgi:hypothetical protein
MKLSEHTLAVLKNFSTINSGVVIQPGTTQTTVSSDESIFVTAELEDCFPEKFGIFNLNQFLGNIMTMNNPDLQFENKCVILNDGSMYMNYYSCNPELIDTPPEGKKLVMRDPDVTFDMSNAMFTKIMRLAAMNNLPNLSVIGKNGQLLVQAHDSQNDTSNQVSSVVSDYDGKTFAFKFKTENLKIIPDDYIVELKIGLFSKFTSKNKRISYYIAMSK